MNRLHLAILLSLAASLTTNYFQMVEYPNFQRRTEMHQQLIEAVAPSQYRHRVLAPYLAQIVIRVATTVVSHTQAFLLTYLSLTAVSFAVGIVAQYLLLLEWFPDVWALLGGTLSAAFLPLTFHYQWFHPWSLVEFALFSLGLLLMERRRYGWLAVVITLASLNRETSLFLVLASVFIAWPDRRALRIAFGYVAIWTIVFIGLRVALGFPPPTFTIAKAWAGNAANWPRALALNVVLFGAFWVCIWRGCLQAPMVLRRAALAVPPYVLLLGVIGYWNEVRYWVTMFPVLVPLGLFGLMAPQEATWRGPAETTGPGGPKYLTR